jgi:hypothetical protein
MKNSLSIFGILYSNESKLVPLKVLMIQKLVLQSRSFYCNPQSIFTFRSFEKTIRYEEFAFHYWNFIFKRKQTRSFKGTNDPEIGFTIPFFLLQSTIYFYVP